MEKKMMSSSLFVLGLVVLAMATTPVVNGITCQDAVSKLLPCQGYLVGFFPISVPCCQSAQSLNQLVTNRDDRKAVCECFKKVAPAVGVNPDKAKQLPQLCNITLSVPIDFNTDCTK
ncbi:non-specific lipid-transfer protein-like [Cornus florida]|uniref:non-specific lipid-transfer protein-like n=1 Tax=Cornus florida TaxID=4283 RepID=UPI00289AAE9D|nr:non-specific lipid-transfer protein-like [Cornus florida]